MPLKIEHLTVARDGKDIIKDVSLEVKPGEVRVLMGPNGSGKSTLANAVMGHPKYQVTGGRIRIDDADVTAMPTNERAKLGLFLSMQATPEIPGVSISNFLRTAYAALKGVKMSPIEFHAYLKSKMEDLKMDPLFSRRSLNAGFSGGEKKRAEILQLSILEPKYAILDETEAGLDVDAFKVVADGINRLRQPERGILIITHYARLLEAVEPDAVSVMIGGRIVAEGGKELAAKIEREGYESLGR